jgi:sulfatase maturation enzyme AslB (radical SAM superfamily)
MNIKDFYIEDSNKPVISNSGVNVLYFTNKCNLACTYCYEDLPGRPPQILSKEDIIRSVDEILKREDPNHQTLIVLFGGEPTLEWENVCFAMDYAYSKKKNIHFNMTTNGIKYLSQDFIDQTKNNFFYKKKLLSIDVSFDGVGNKDRVFHNGMESTPFMVKIFKKLLENNFRFRIRYTIHKLNIRRASEDITRLIKTFRPERLITSVAWDTLNEKDMKLLDSIKQDLRLSWINNEIQSPVCSLFCDICDGCSIRKEIKTYFTDEGNVTKHYNNELSPKFADFKQKELI